MRAHVRLLKTGMYWGLMLSLVIFELATVPPVQAATRDEVGIATGATLLRMNDKDLDSRLADIERLGATWIRVDFSWPAIQPEGPTIYHWKMYDRVVRVAGVHHLKILAVLDYTAPWAAEPRCATLVITKAAAQKCNPQSNAAFARFARTAAIRYKHQSIRAWEIWNEPNLSSYWKTARRNKTVYYDPRAYAALANAAAREIRHNSPGTLVVTGGLAPMFEPKFPKGMRQSDFLAQMLPYLNPKLFDAVGVHPYSWPVPPARAVSYNAFYTVDQGRPKDNLRTIMARAGWGNKQIWGTEYGAPTTGARAVAQPTKRNRPDHVTEASQAQIVKQGLDIWYDKANVGPLFVHSDSDQWLPTSHKNEDGFGLRRSDGSKKPAYDAFRTVAQQVQGRY
ncbi:MAG TPA: cellulase family glycosylhydrolase [Candidatus Saccharimonadia bacterium]|nr:cellulase family glycosylhydrolase [Candidatus Saccharimonadia bacterium]